MGEEPDGQYFAPEDYATLYLQWATALHQVDPNLKLGGPVFEGVSEDIKFWPNAEGETSWFKRFLAYLKAHDRLSDLSFMSYEHYPYYDGTCEGPWSNLFKEPEVLTHIVQVWRDDGLPDGVPMFNTETNAPGGDAAVDVFGALWLGETFPAFLTAGGKASYYHHAMPYSTPHPACSNSWGTYHMFTTDHNWLIKQRTSQFFAAQMLTQEWAQPVDAEHRLFHAASDIKDAEGHALVTVYPVLRPDGQWSLMLINKDYDKPHTVIITFHDEDAKRRAVFCWAGRENYIRKRAVSMALRDARRLRRSRWPTSTIHSARWYRSLHATGGVDDRAPRASGIASREGLCDWDVSDSLRESSTAKRNPQDPRARTRSFHL